MNTNHDMAQALQSGGALTLRYALVTNLVWIGRLKFEDYEVENIHPLVSSSPLFSPVLKRLDEKRVARLVGVSEIVLGSMIAAQPFAARVSVIGGLGAIGMFATTLSFLVTTPGVRQEGHGRSKLSMVGQFLLKDGVFLGASVLATAESLRAAQRG